MPIFVKKEKGKKDIADRLSYEYEVHHDTFVYDGKKNEYWYIQEVRLIDGARSAYSTSSLSTLSAPTKEALEAKILKMLDTLRNYNEG